MEPTPDLIDDIFIEKILRARAQTPEQKLLDGPRLFAFACEAARAGILIQHPNATPDEVNHLLRERLELVRRLEEATDG